MPGRPTSGGPTFPIRLQLAGGQNFQFELRPSRDSPLLEPLGNRGDRLAQRLRKRGLRGGLEMLFYLIGGHSLLVYGIP
jgi:hypothetical protein